MTLSRPDPAAALDCRSHAKLFSIVRDASGQQIAYVYYESEPGRRSAAKLLTRDEAMRVLIQASRPIPLGIGYLAIMIPVITTTKNPIAI